MTHEKLEYCPNCGHFFAQLEYDLQYCSADNCGWNRKNFPPSDTTPEKARAAIAKATGKGE